MNCKFVTTLERIVTEEGRHKKIEFISNMLDSGAEAVAMTPGSFSGNYIDVLPP